MSATGLEVFDKTLQTTHVWLKDLMEDEAIGPDRQLVWHVLMPDQTTTFGSQLPLLVRGAYYDQFVPARLPNRIRSLEGFLESGGEDLAMSRSVNIHDSTRATWTGAWWRKPARRCSKRSALSGLRTRMRPAPAGRAAMPQARSRRTDGPQGPVAPPLPR